MTHNASLKALKALGVILRDARIKLYLMANDRQAYAQCEEAFDELERELEPSDDPARPRSIGCPGCGAGKGWIERNPALHEQNCGGVGKTMWERKGIE